MTTRVPSSQSSQRFCLQLLALLCLLLAGLLPGAQANSQVLQLDASETRISLLPWISYLRDPQGELELQQIIAADDSFRHAGQRSDINFAYTSDHAWLRLNLQSTATQTSRWVLEMQYPSLDRVWLYDPQQGDRPLAVAGDVIPRLQRSMDHLSPAFTLELQPGEQRTLYLRVSSAGSMTLDSVLWSEAEFRYQSNNSYLMLLAYFGMALALGCYNLLLFLVLRQASFGYYVLFVVTLAGAVMAVNGTGPQFIWPNAGEAGNRILPLSFTLAATFALLFARAFLNTRELAPGWDCLLRWAAALGAFASLLTLLLSVRAALQLMSISGLLITLLIMACGIHCMWRGLPAARIFVLAWCILLGGALVLALRNFALIPSNFLSVYAIQIGSALELLLLSLGLAARFNEIERQKEQAQLALLESMQVHEMQLEQGIAERTEALQQANARLEQLALEDPLTGLANRTALGNHLQQAMLRTSRRGDLLALLMMDLDGFKPVNDRLGHDCGDQVLVEVAVRLREVARKNDLVARMGGDEFVIVCENIADINAARDLAERILQALQQPMKLGCSDQIRIAASIGISLSDGLQPTASTLLNQADQAMYRSKRDSREPISLFSETPSA
ncbi:diguanylate cyclase (GGDEF) domain-containing protein [Halopseudomonas yangmingensis]|uniref:Diguanylate cyclase (GGDEF) domain-containing protein n=1 Tax=Halopseudomonas yangmingensis TaxID=1720063 RepID=A0A1I4PA81_9GAMM|nr:diguanylate cyclase (GGDEF) domain-containing protein [Halopseudomonas yangmingensis]